MRARLDQCLAGGMGSGGRLAHRDLVLAKGTGAEAIDCDGNSYVDYVLGFGALILGHAPAELRDVLAATFDTGTMFGTACEAEANLACAIQGILPCAERVRFTSSGTEAAMAAIRLARAATGRDRILKFDGHFHGWSDTSFFGAEDGVVVPLSPGQTQHAANDVLVAEWNDRASVTRAMEQYGREIACLVLEPYPTGKGCIPPIDGFLDFLQGIAKSYGALLVFDEVVSGFRFALGGAQAIYGVTPDLCIFGKALGGGLPIAGFAGRSGVMDQLRANRVVHLGTYNSNPLCANAALAVLKALGSGDGLVLSRIAERGRKLRDRLNALFQELAAPLCCAGPGAVVSLFAAPTPPLTFRDTLDHNAARLAALHRRLLDHGIWLLARGNFMISAAHTEAHIDETVETMRHILTGNTNWGAG